MHLSVETFRCIIQMHMAKFINSNCMFRLVLTHIFD